VDAVEVFSRRARETYLITNNHFRGRAALNALELCHHLRRVPVPVPPPLLAAYPELRSIAVSVSKAHTSCASGGRSARMCVGGCGCATGRDPEDSDPMNHQCISPQEARQPEGGMMMEPTDEAVLHRLARVERGMRRWQVIGSMALALLALVALLGAVGGPDGDAREELRGRALVLVDREGRPRMDVRMTQHDTTHLVLLDREGLPRMSLNLLSQGGADLVIRDQLGLPRATLGVVPDGRPSLSLYDGAGKTRVSLGLFPDGQARLVLYDQGGQPRWATP
jgi:hypothetical protein